MMDVNVNVENSRMMKEKLKDSEDNVIDIAKPRSFGLFRMVQPP